MTKEEIIHRLQYARYRIDNATYAPDVLKAIDIAIEAVGNTDSDTISRQAAIDAVGINTWAGQRLLKVPPAQPEIVRCKDCKYAEYIDDVQTLWCTECGQGRTVAPYDFCSYGERREDE